MLRKILGAIIFGAVVLNFACGEVAEKPVIVEKFVNWTEYREQLTREYSKLHYGFSITRIEPQAVVVHWTAGGTFESAYKTFYDEAMTYGEDSGTVNVSSQFIVDRDGTIYQLMPENYLAKHAIGYNWCAIGIENVGGVNGAEDLTQAQLESDLKLIRYLKEKYPAIKYIFGHYQQVTARASGLFIENIPDYFAEKIDPGKIFMQQLQDNLQGEDFIFFDP